MWCVLFYSEHADLSMSVILFAQVQLHISGRSCTKVPTHFTISAESIHPCSTNQLQLTDGKRAHFVVIMNLRPITRADPTFLGQGMLQMAMFGHMPFGALLRRSGVS